MTVVICAKFCHRLRTSSTTITISSNNLLNYVAADQLRSLLLVRRTITTNQGRRHVGEAALLPGKVEILPHLEETSFYSTLVLVPRCHDNKERLRSIFFENLLQHKVDAFTWLFTYFCQAEQITRYFLQFGTHLVLHLDLSQC